MSSVRETENAAALVDPAITVKRDHPLLREQGRSLFPVSRMQKIIKADKELPIVAKEAVFIMSIATEEFIKRIAAASQKQAEREKRATVQKKDVAVIAKKADEFFFLEGRKKKLIDMLRSLNKSSRYHMRIARAIACGH
ncbi:hypothetical protein M0805_006255 [Coniferiporia weirii]|nr:hypothetical protein M0805_006255 [Coniferiporia weirii]